MSKSSPLPAVTVISILAAATFYSAMYHEIKPSSEIKTLESAGFIPILRDSVCEAKGKKLDIKIIRTDKEQVVLYRCAEKEKNPK